MHDTSAAEHNAGIISIEEFANRLGISRSTAYTWLAEGRLVTGRHVLRIGRVVRILWSDELMAHLLSLSVAGPKVTERPPLKRTGKGGRNRLALNPDLLDSLENLS